MSYRELAPSEVIVSHVESSEIENILSCELAAAEVYREVIALLDPSSETWKLELLMHDHEDAVSYWKTQVKTSDQNTHAHLVWSKVRKKILSKTNQERDPAAFKNLRDAELSETKLYKDLLNNSSITAAQKSYIKTILLPAHESHLKRLERMSSHALELAR